MEVEMFSRLAVIHADYYRENAAALKYENQAAAVNPGQPALTRISISLMNLLNLKPNL